MRKSYHVFALVAIIAIICLSGIFFSMQQTETKNQTLTILCATSLYYPLQKVQSDFEKAYPNINVEIQPHGSIQVIRQVTEENETADLIMVADYSLIPAMMYNADVPGTNQGFADYYIRFASNSMVLAYTNRSQYADDINSTNWYSILTQPNVKIGLVNPELDSLGYRSLIAIQLASSYYGDPELFHDLITNNFNPPIDCIANGSNYVITIPTTQQPSGDKITLRASEVDLIPLLQEDYLDYCFLYLSNAKQYNFSYISLPDQINLGSTQYDENYSQVQVIYAHQRFTQITLDRTGEAIYYGMTIPTNAPNPELATLFMQFILNGQGKNDFAQSWQPILTPSFTDNLQLIPNSLQPYVAKDPLPVNYIS